MSRKKIIYNVTFTATHLKRLVQYIVDTSNGWWPSGNTKELVLLCPSFTFLLRRRVILSIGLSKY